MTEKSNERKICIIGLGYVGLPVALAFGREFVEVVGFDIDSNRISSLVRGEDTNREYCADELLNCGVRFVDDPAELKTADFFIICAPTPVDAAKRPDLSRLEAAAISVGNVISKGAIVVVESTVYPGLTEEIVGRIIAAESGLTAGKDFFLGYSPERINPGDKDHGIDKVIKVVSADTPESLAVVEIVYRRIAKAGVYVAPSIRVAEAAKVIENTQRDLNIALMNELALIFDRIGISTREVLAAAGTKWNFLKFSPGLVGGHCIGVDPYYLTTKAEQLGYQPQVILAGRRINDQMSEFVASRTVKLLVDAGCPLDRAKVGILGLTFKEDVTDIRNSRVPVIVEELREYKIEPVVCDPVADKDAAKKQYGLKLIDITEMAEFDAIILAVAHKDFLKLGLVTISSLLKAGGVLVDVKSVFPEAAHSSKLRYWAL